MLDATDNLEITTVVSSLGNGKAPGCDGITVKVLKNNIDVLASIKAGLFNYAMQEGEYPDILKIVKVILAYKGGDVSNPGSYRPISVLSVVNAVFKKLISVWQNKYLSADNIITSSEHMVLGLVHGSGTDADHLLHYIMVT